MPKILLAIKPIYVEKIFSGEKKYEYRRRIGKRKIEKIVIYATAPIKRVVGEVEVRRTICDYTNRLWENTREYSGISKKFYDEYFNNQDKAYAYELGEIKKFKEPRQLDEYGINSAPQSFIYLD